MVRALSRLTTSSMPNKCAERHAQCEQARKTVHLPSSGSLLLAQTVLNATTNRHAAPVVRMARTRHSSERAHTSVPHKNDPRKAAAAPPAPTWRPARRKTLAEPSGCVLHTAIRKRAHLNVGRSWQAGGRRLAGEVCRRIATWPYSLLQTIWSASACSMRMPSIDQGEEHAEGQEP